MNDYFYLDNNNQQQGPVSPLYFAAHNITPETKVWCNGMKDWTRAGDVDELRSYFTNTQQTTTPPPPPAGNNGTAYNQGYNQGYNQTPNYGQATNGNQQPNMQPCPDSNLVWAILTTVLCCLPFGIVAIIYACKVNDRFAMGDIQGAYDASEKAKKWSIYGAAASLVICILYFILIFALGISASNF